MISPHDEIKRSRIRRGSLEADRRSTLREASLVLSENPGQNGSVVELGLTFIDPLKQERRFVTCSESKEEELVESRRGTRGDPSLRLRRLLNRVFVLSTVSRPCLILLVGDVSIRVIYSHDTDTDRIPSCSLKMFYLPR